MPENFSPVDWSLNTNIYEVNLRQYTAEGTINAFAFHLERLKEMGVKTLWFMPLTPIAQKNKKGSLGSYYACSDYITISPEFGNADDFKKLVDEAHTLGLKVIIDWVANHTGWDHRWTEEHPEWYKKDAFTNDFQVASGMDDIIELDYSNSEMRKAMIDAMRYWVTAFDIDGFRSDLAFWVEINFWNEARTELEKIKKLFWLGELDPLDNPEYMGIFDAAYTWTWMHKTKDFYQNQLTLSFLDSVLYRYDEIGNKSIRAWFTSNHDENSWNGTEYEKYDDMAKPLAVFSCTWNGIPLIYSGQELPNKKRLNFFEKDVINWSDKILLHDFYKNLLNLHSNNPALRSGDENAKTFRLKTTDDANVFSFLRKNGENEVLVILNFSKNEIIRFKILDEKINGKFENVFQEKVIDINSETDLEMKAWGFLVFEK